MAHRTLFSGPFPVARRAGRGPHCGVPVTSLEARIRSLRALKSRIPQAFGNSGHGRCSGFARALEAPQSFSGGRSPGAELDNHKSYVLNVSVPLAFFAGCEPRAHVARSLTPAGAKIHDQHAMGEGGARQ